MAPAIEPSIAVSPVDTDDVDDDPQAAAEVQSTAIRQALTLRINRASYPSRLINQIALADRRSADATQVLARWLARSPKILRVIRVELYKAFELDPDSLLFTEPVRPGVPTKVDSLTDRALLLLVLPSVPININQFTTLSVKGDPARRLPYTPLEALQRVIALKLLDRLGGAVSDYWNTLAAGSWLTRQERWAELHAGHFADRAFVAWQLDELSQAGMALLQALIDAPSVADRQRAGGDWASVRACPLLWPGQARVAIPGALHVYREVDPAEAPHVIYLPGMARNFYEYRSFAGLQQGLVTLTSAPSFDELWQCMPVKRRHELSRSTPATPTSCVFRGALITGDALALSARALLDGQWNNELTCALMINLAHVYSPTRPRPAPLKAVPFLTLGDAR
ncbi:dermonecrotic toxin domain-containing protein [Pseudomonas lactucae]|uniref:dermonecrotic toxin domain-containing protein n=1 Tax=Pseudomonas lactucae TaxID=2813360 RepID=UPI001CED8EA8|nr:DUF6543 domain-containing protein [Pseudomonas lactucae]